MCSFLLFPPLLHAPSSPYFFQLEAEAFPPVAGQNIGILCPLKPNKKIQRQSLEGVERWL